MTTIVVDFRNGVIAADTQNTDRSNTAYRCRKIERLKDGRFFLGSGHLLTIGKIKRWAEAKFAETARPDFSEMFGKRSEEFGFSCIVINRDGTAVLVDDEMEPQPVFDQYLAIGSGGAYAIGALDAGADAKKAVEIACGRDLYTSAPVEIERIRFTPRKRRA